ncbi:rCG61367 [Rattus norvegicus]|uniref:RCG61367 n=1 Tax=Rattus norvegicus TaxID=10116 RepID=A6HBC1_RAT|nr:rCG61367 [Rattus norvegicus]
MHDLMCSHIACNKESKHTEGQRLSCYWVLETAQKPHPTATHSKSAGKIDLLLT